MQIFSVCVRACMLVSVRSLCVKYMCVPRVLVGPRRRTTGSVKLKVETPSWFATMLPKSPACLYHALSLKMRVFSVFSVCVCVCVCVCGVWCACVCVCVFVRSLCVNNMCVPRVQVGRRRRTIGSVKLKVETPSCSPQCCESPPRAYTMHIEGASA